MNNYSPIFTAARILLPAFRADPGRMLKWAVIACDQFTSAPAYWEKCRGIIGDAPSAYRFVMPEAYLGSPEEAAHDPEIAESMAEFSERSMTAFDGFVYLERTLPDGKIRHGIV